MKIGIISDVHSNLYALSAVLDFFNKINVDKIICLGDIIGIGNKPDETVKELIKYKDKLYSVKGNHEKYLIDGLPEYIHGNKKLSEDEINNHKWNHSKLSKRSKKFLYGLKKELYIELNSIKLYISHFPLSEKGEYLLIDKENHRELSYFNNINTDICLFGHSHKCYFDKSNKYIINPGSLGCPKGRDYANAGLLEINELVTYKQLSIKYDVNKTIEEIIISDMPMKKDIIKEFYKTV